MTVSLQPRSPRRSRDRGQTLLLAPIALLIVVILGSVTLEVAAMHLHQRQLDDLADSLANDAATVGFDVDHFRQTGTLAINATEAAKVLGPGIAISNLPSATATSGVGVTPGAEPQATVELSYEHEFVFGQLIFGASTTLTATGDAALEVSGP